MCPAFYFCEGNEKLMRVLALVGPSGTGKSHRALLVAHDYKIDLIIDDGLLIKGNRVVAGKSAKKEFTKIKAIKRAIFMDEEHAREVKNKIKELKPSSILILGTSKSMIERIAQTLDIPKPEKYIDIKDIADEKSIKKAKIIRDKQGKHVIPVPTFQIKKDFSGYLVDPLKIFYRKTSGIKNVAEKSVVRPTFSYLGSYKIADTAIISIVNHVGPQVKGIDKVRRVNVINNNGSISLDIQVVVEYGTKIHETLKDFQIKVKQTLEYITALNVEKLDVIAVSMIVSKRK